MTTPLRFELDHVNFRFLRSYMQNKCIYFIAGTHSMFVPSRNEKYLMSNRPDGTRILRDWTDENGNTYAMTPSEAARCELRKTFPGLRRVGWMSSHVKLFDWRWPMLFTGARQGDGVYIDLKGAYHQIYSRLWLDTAFPNGYGTLWLGNIADSLKDWKGARNSLIGVTAARDTIGVKGCRTIRLKTNNPYLAPGLWAQIQAILNELAFQAELLGACYIATDGYIFPDFAKARHFEEILLDNGLKYRTKRGKYEVKNFGAYKVEGRETIPYQRNSSVFGQGIRAINLLDPDYPTRCLRWWSKSIAHYSHSRWEGGVKEWQRVV